MRVNTDDEPPPSSRRTFEAPRATPVPKIITRSIAARLLGCSLGSVRYYEKIKRLNPKTGRDGVKRFDMREIERLALYRRRNGHRTEMGITGDVVANVLRMLRDGQSVSEVCIKLELFPYQVREIWQESKRGLDERGYGHEAVSRVWDVSDLSAEKEPDGVAAQILAARRRRRGGE
jgi:DNA-binding transcriptional MerR regulator